MSALREVVEGGPVDVVSGVYLAELTMLILWRTRSKDPTRGYATTFLRSAWRERQKDIPWPSRINRWREERE